MKEFQDALDSLLPFLGLWPALKIGTFHRVLTLRCPEEMTQYLVRIRETWCHILGECIASFTCLDSHTVTVLQGRNAHYSSADFHQIEKLMLQREVFSSDVFENQRPSILARLKSIKYIIPSLHTFLEDTKYLEPCAKIMKSILPINFKGSIREAFTHQHNGCLDWNEQLTEHSQAPRRSYSGLQARWYSYRQLWLFTWRHFPAMIGQAPRKNVKKTQEIGNELQCGWWSEFSRLASTCGYENMRNMYPDVDDLIIREFLRNARPPQFYQLDQQDLDEKARRLGAILANIQRRPCKVTIPLLSSNTNTYVADITARCGRPFQQSFEDDANCLFLQHIYREYEPPSECSAGYLTTFAVKRDIFQAFFGCTPMTASPASIPRVPALQPLLQQGTNLPSHLSARSPPSPTRDPDLTSHSPGHRPQSEPASPPATELTTPLSPTSTQPRFTHTTKRSAETVHSQSAWQLARLYSKPSLNDVLTVISPISPYDQALFRVERPSVEKILQIAKVLDVRGQNVEHVYMSHNDMAGLKFIDGKTIVQQAHKTKKQIIFKIPLGIVDKLKHQYEAMAQQVTLQNSQ